MGKRTKNVPSYMIDITLIWVFWGIAFVIAFGWKYTSYSSFQEGMYVQGRNFYPLGQWVWKSIEGATIVGGLTGLACGFASFLIWNRHQISRVCRSID